MLKVIVLFGVLADETKYPADGFGFSAGMGDKMPTEAEITEHRQIGPKDIIKRISDQTKLCPGTKFALVGYSQGGMVTFGAASLLSSEHQDLAKNIVAVVLYGSGNGTNILLPQSEVLANCARGDIACPAEDNPSTPLGHVSYNDQGSKWHDRSAQFIVSAFEGKALGPKLKKTATEEL
jgi:pimeloyl-ACP methyl ester carboxylesterase